MFCKLTLCRELTKHTFCMLSWIHVLLNIGKFCLYAHKKSLKIPKGQSESVNWRTDIIMAKRTNNDLFIVIKDLTVHGSPKQIYNQNISFFLSMNNCKHTSYIIMTNTISEDQNQLLIINLKKLLIERTESNLKPWMLVSLVNDQLFKLYWCLKYCEHITIICCFLITMLTLFKLNVLDFLHLFSTGCDTIQT
jgi:hypothetical protein